MTYTYISKTTLKQKRALISLTIVWAAFAGIVYFSSLKQPNRPSPLQRDFLSSQATEAKITDEENKQKSRNITDMVIQLGDLRTLPERDDLRTVLCFVFSTLLDTGGVENWWWTLFNRVFTKFPFTVYAVKITDIWSHDLVRTFSREGLRFNPDDEMMVSTCDIIIQTGTQPLPKFMYARKVPRILVIHGSSGNSWTLRYTSKALHYDKIVAVSRDSVDTLPENHRSRAVVIHNALDPKRLNATVSADFLKQLWKLPSDKKILLFIGRISSEKDPQFFIDTVSHLPPSWIGLMVGPIYFKQSIPDRIHDRIFMVGKWTSVGDVYNLVDVVLLPSPSEGGPIVLLEAWALKKPFFMRSTGIACEHPEGVFLVHDYDTPQTIAQRVAKLSLDQAPDRTIIENGFKIFNENYHVDLVTKKWEKVLNETIELTRTPMNFVMPLFITHTNTDISVKIIGRTRLITTGEGDQHMVHLNLFKYMSITNFNVRITIEYITISPGPHSQLGSARLFYFDSYYAAHNVSETILPNHIHHVILDLPETSVLSSWTGFYLSLDLLSEVQFRLTHVGWKNMELDQLV